MKRQQILSHCHFQLLKFKMLLFQQKFVNKIVPFSFLLLLTNIFFTKQIAEVAPYSVVGLPTQLTVTITNQTDVLQEFSLNVKENNTTFVFAGERESTFAVHPASSKSIKHTLGKFSFSILFFFFSQLFFFNFSHF